MSWVRIDDHCPENPKLLRAGAEAAWLWLCGLAYCSRNLTDGFVPAEAISGLAGREAADLVDRLVSVDLWDRVDGGFRVHDYLEFNPSKAQVKAKQAASAERVAGWKRRKGHAHDIDGNASGNALVTALPARSESVPVTRLERVSNTAPDPDPDPLVPPIAPQRGAIPMRPRQLRKQAEHIRSKVWMRCQHDPPCSGYGACVNLLAEELRQGSVAQEETA